MAEDDRDTDQEESDNRSPQNAESGTREEDAENVRRTTDPTLLRSVIEDRGGYPAHVPETEGEGDQGLLRVGFHDRDEDLKEISWDEFQEEIQEKDLVGIYTEDGTDVDEDRPVVLRSRDD